MKVQPIPNTTKRDVIHLDYVGPLTIFMQPTTDTFYKIIINYVYSDSKNITKFPRFGRKRLVLH